MLADGISFSYSTMFSIDLHYYGDLNYQRLLFLQDYMLINLDESVIHTHGIFYILTVTNGLSVKLKFLYGTIHN